MKKTLLSTVMTRYFRFGDFHPAKTIFLQNRATAILAIKWGIG